MECCFVCCEDTPPLYQVCRCNARIHASCFRSLVMRVPSHQSKCPVCTHVYRSRPVLCNPYVCAFWSMLLTWMGLFGVIVWGKLRGLDVFFMITFIGVLTFKQNAADHSSRRRYILPAMLQAPDGVELCTAVTA